jgi:hypothetical protein
MENNPITWNEAGIPFCFVLIKLTNAPLTAILSESSSWKWT